MSVQLAEPDLQNCGLSPGQAAIYLQQINSLLATFPAELAWQHLTKQIFSPVTPFALQLLVFSKLFPEWEDHPETAPIYLPDPELVASSQLQAVMTEKGFSSVQDFHAWTVKDYRAFWQAMVIRLGIVFQQQPREICTLGSTPEATQWLTGSTLNIAASCFTAEPGATALLFPGPAGQLLTMSYGELDKLSNRVANSLIVQGLKQGDAIAIDMTMTSDAVAIYLGIIKMGGVVVSIADSFATEEIALRLQISQAKAIFTQDIIIYGEKTFSLYAKVSAANCPLVIVIPAGDAMAVELGDADLVWQDFLVGQDDFASVACQPMQPCNILFSSGTTGMPKAIPWNHTTPVKAATDACLHQNIQAGDVLAWPTSLGWMMGPWLIFAALINRAAMVCYPYPARGRDFGDFIARAKVTMLGVVPTLVASWRQSDCMRGVDWSAIKIFSSTGESSRAIDMLYLSSLAGYKPIIEYCGGTEIGGSYVSSTILQNNYLTLFSTQAFGSQFILLDEKKQPANYGEVALIPPALGLSMELLNSNHHQIYFEGMPVFEATQVRRHGDTLCRLSNGYYCVLGRNDDTMNLGGIKISAVEIERVLSGMDDINESAAIAVAENSNGPSKLVIFATSNQEIPAAKIQAIMQARINQHLNPLFKIHEVILLAELPKTASNKIMRRMLREKYQTKKYQTNKGSN